MEIFPDSENSWEPETHFDDIAIIRTYWEDIHAHNKKGARKKTNSHTNTRTDTHISPSLATQIEQITNTETKARQAIKKAHKAKGTQPHKNTGKVVLPTWDSGVGNSYLTPTPRDEGRSRVTVRGEISQYGNSTCTHTPSLAVELGLATSPPGSLHHLRGTDPGQARSEPLRHQEGTNSGVTAVAEQRSDNSQRGSPDAAMTPSHDSPHAESSSSSSHSATTPRADTPNPIEASTTLPSRRSTRAWKPKTIWQPD